MKSAKQDRFIRENLIFLTTFIVSVFLLIIAAWISFREELIQNELTPQEFQQTIIMQTNRDNNGLSGQAATDFIASAPSVVDGLESILSRQSAEKLAALPEVESIVIIAKSSWKLTTSSGIGQDVTLFNVSKNFLEVFPFGSATTLKPGTYLPTKQLRANLGLHDGIELATLGVPDSMTSELPLKMREAIDWSKAKVQIKIQDSALPNLQGSSLFSNAIFTAGREEKIQIPGLFVFPKISILVKIRHNVSMHDAMQTLNVFASSAMATNRDATIEILPFSTLFNKQLDTNYVAATSARLQLGTYVISAALLILLVFIRYQQVKREILLRRTIGSSLITAILISLKPIAIAICFGTFFATIVVFSGAFLFLKSISVGLLSEALVLSGLCIGSIVVLAGASSYLGSDDLANSLKRE